MNTYDVEYTDTFGGESNYSWVRRYSVTISETYPDNDHKRKDTYYRELVRKAKALAGLTGVKCRREEYGDLIALYPRGSCTVLFINFREANHE